jgi:signal transduction histidine kinase
LPGLLTKYGLFEAVVDLFEGVDDMEGMTAEVSVEGEEKRLKENTEIMLYRIIQEMVNNTLKHAQAKKVHFEMKVLGDQLNLVYSDDGKGFDVDQKLKAKSLGLTSIMSRVKFLNGEIEVLSKTGEGCVFKIQIPI